jgi:hypothetical protein
MKSLQTSTNLALLLLVILVLSCLASCGGGSASSGLDNTLSSGQTGVDTKDTRSLAIGSSLPSLPANLKPSSGSRTTSSATQLDFTGSGSALVQYAGGAVDGDNLVLTSTADNVAWAMYKADDLFGLRVTSFSLTTQPGSEDTYYGIGLSNFTFGRWQWQQYTNLADVSFDLAGSHHRLTNMSGHLYWVVAVPKGGFTVTVNSASIAVDDQDTWLPGGGNFMFASHGLPGVVELQWGTIDAATSYELYRREASGPPGDPNDANDAEFALLATVDTTYYEDTSVTPNVWYEYKVCAANDNGEGGFSATAFGIAREADSGGAVVNACGKIVSITADAVSIEMMRDGSAKVWILTADTQYASLDGTAVDVSYFQPDMFVSIRGSSEDPAGLYPVANLMVELDADALPPLPPPHHGRHDSSFGTITEYTADHVQITTDGFFTKTFDYVITADTVYMNEQGEAVTFDYFSVGMRAFIKGATNSEGTLTAQAICAERAVDGGGQPGGPPQDPHQPGLPPFIGAIDSITDTLLAVTNAEGVAQSYIINDHTQWIGADGAPLDATQFAAGETVLVLAMATPDGNIALVVHKDAGGCGAP